MNRINRKEAIEHARSYYSANIKILFLTVDIVPIEWHTVLDIYMRKYRIARNF